jgi:hypothetical protein
MKRKVIVLVMVVVVVSHHTFLFTMENNNNFGQKERNFRDIVLKAVEKIYEILSKELRLYSNIIPFSNHRSDLVIEQEDTRESFCQAVQGLALILKPYFDEEMEEVYEGFDDLCDMYYFEFYNAYKDYINETLKLGEEFLKRDDTKIDKELIESMRIRFKIKSAKIIFRELNRLLKRQDYLKSAIYGDSDESDDIIEDDGGDD